MTAQSIEEIVEILDEHYNKGNTSQEIMNSVNSLTTNANNLEVFKNMLESTEIPPEYQFCKLHAANLFRRIVQNFVEYFDFFKDAKNVADWIIEFLTTAPRLDDFFYRDLGAAASIIFSKFYDKNFKIILVEIRSFLKDTDLPKILPFIMVHSEILDSFREADDKNRDLFFNQQLVEFFSISKDILIKADDDQFSELPPQEISQIVKSACSNLAKCIAFKEEKTFHTNKEFKEYLSDKEFQMFLFHIYEKYSEPKVLDVISSYFEVNPFTKIDVYAEVVDNLFNGLSQIIHNQIGFNPTSILTISIILFNISKRINQRILVSNFCPLIEAVAQFSIMSFKDFSDQQNVAENVISFWPNIETILYYEEAAPIREIVGPKLFDIYSVYIEFLLNEITNPDELSKNRIIDIDNFDNKVSTFISPIQSFLNLDTEKVYGHLMEVYHSKKTEFEQCLSNGENLENVQKQIAIFIQIFTKLLQSKPYNERGSENNKIFVESFSEIFSLIQMTNEPLSQRVLFPEIDISLYIFISIFPKLFEATRLTTNEAFYHEISQPLGISNSQMCQDIFFRRIISAIQSYYDSPYEKAIVYNLIVIMTQKVLPSSDLVHEILQTNFEETFNFTKNLKLRTLFINSLMTIINNLDNSTLYENLLAHFEAKFKELPSLEAIIILATDIRGIFYKNISARYYHRHIDVFFPDNMNKFAESLSSSLSSSPTDQDLEVVNLSLKMCKSIVSPNAKIDKFSSKLIEFEHNSANGIILFSFSAQIISIFLTFLSGNLENPQFAKDFDKSGFREFKCCSKILANLISSGYVPFEAFLVYEDSVFADVLTGYIQLLTSLDLDSVCSYPNTFQSLINFFEVLCKHMMKIMCIQLSSEFLRDLMSVIFECAARGLFMNKDSTTSSIKTIEYILQFIIDEESPKEIEALVGSIKEEDLGKANMCLWQLLINSNEINHRNLVSEPIKFLIQINKSAFQVVKEKILVITKTQESGEIAKAVNDFEENLDEALVSDASVMRKNLINLKLKINEKVVAVDFLS